MKSEKNIQHYDSSRFRNEEETDGASIISLLLCSVGMFTRNKLFIWISLFFIISTLCRKKYGSSYSPYLINGSMIIFAIVNTYVLQPQYAPQSWYVRTYLNNQNSPLSSTVTKCKIEFLKFLIISLFKIFRKNFFLFKKIILCENLRWMRNTLSWFLSFLSSCFWKT